LARPREFDEDAALEGAMNVFWNLGYDGASLPELLDGMGLTRGSLYKAYKDKKSLFMLILQRYDEAAVKNAISLLTNDNIEDGIERIEKLFLNVVNTTKKRDYRGCLLCSAAAGPAHEDADIAEVIHAMLGTMRSAFEVALRHSKYHSKLDDGEVRELSQMLLTQYMGLRIQSRSKASAKTLEASVASLLHMLKIQPTQKKVA